MIADAATEAAAAAAAAAGGILGISEAGWIEIFKTSPAIVALLIVIFFMYRIVVSKDRSLHDLIAAGSQDIERQSKILTLLEILVNRK